MTSRIQTVSSLLLFGFLTTFVVIHFFDLTEKRNLKKTLEIERIKARNSDKEPCEQYALIAAIDG